MKFRLSSTKLRYIEPGEDVRPRRFSRMLRLSLAAAAVITTMAITSFVGTAGASSAGWTSVAPTISTHTTGAAVTGQDGKIYVFGGRNGPFSKASAEAYTPSSNSWAMVAPMPTARLGLAAALGPAGKIYVLGGYGNHEVRCKNEVYDPKTNTWATKAPMPVGGEGIAAATGADGKIYVFGGYRRNFGADGNGDLNTVQIYDPIANTWTVNHSMPADLEWSSAALGSNRKIYFMGGWNSSSGISTRVWSYDTSSHVWTQVASTSVGHRLFGAVAVPGGTIYAIAGEIIETVGNEYPLKSVEAYSIASNTWSRAPSLPSGKYGLSAAASGDSIYEIAGSPLALRDTKSVMSYTP
jgi:N-acetylneuraminic acid mutarotase